MQGLLTRAHKTILLFWLCIILTVGSLHSQNFVSEYETIMAETADAEQAAKIDSLLDRAIALDSVNVAIKLTHDFSIAKYKQRDYHLAITYGLKEIELYESLGEVTEKYIQVIYNVGRFYFRNQEYEASIKLHQNIVDLNFSEGTIGRSICEIGVNYFAMGDYFKGVDNYKIGILHLENSDRQKLLIRNYLNLSNRYELINTPEALGEKLKILNRMTELDKESPFTYDMKASLYNSFASYYNNDHIFDFERSKSYQRQFLDLATAAQDSTRIANSYANFGNLYMEVKNDSAVYFFQRALDFYQDEEDVIRTYNNLARYEFIKGNWEQALQKAHSTFKRASKMEIDLDSVPKAETLVAISDKYSILYAFSYKTAAYIKLYETSKKEVYLSNAIRHLKTADHLINLLQLESEEEDSKLYWRKEATSIYSLGILASYYSNQNELAFYYNEKNKALLLTEAIIENVQKSDLPKALLRRELELKRTALSLKQRYDESTSTTIKNSLQRKLITAKNHLETYTDSLQSNYPSYALDQDRTSIRSLTEVQQYLPEDHLLLSYIWEESLPGLPALFVMAVGKNEVALFRIEEKQLLEAQMRQFSTSVRQPFATSDDLKRFKQNAHALYTGLLPSEALRSMLKGKQLIIVPDGPLQNIPFEALISETESLTYFIQNNEMSYAYSMSFLMHNAKIARAATKDFIAYAPGTFRQNDLPELSYTITEVSAIQESMGGTIRLNQDATKASFLNHANDFEVLHLATHADAGKFPWIAFQDEILETHELYTMNLQAELVVLSACKSAAGVTATGEGVFSLARGFFYSGANAIVSSLWNVNDKATANIMTDFYKGLKNGARKSEALRTAKINYLQSSSLSDASPYYWASFVLIGEHSTMENIQESYGLTFYLIVLAAILLLLVIAYFFKKNRKPG